MMNDLLFEGFARAVGRGVDAWLVLVERESSWEQEEARRILAELGVGNRVSWLEPDDRAGFTWAEMPKQYNASDIVVSGFAGWTALVSLEGAACGKPVITNLEPHAMEAISSEGDPFVQASTIEEIEEAIVMLAAPLQRESIGQASRKWIIDNYDRERVAQRCLALLAANGFDT
jgi:glycosyltransferase involved in cell wall biosynthesis